jgi:hypothetical protein
MTPWQQKTSTLARAMRAGLNRADVAAAGLDADQARTGDVGSRGIVTGGFDFEPEELHEYSLAMGEAYAQALAEQLAERVIGVGDEPADGPRVERVARQIAAGLDEAGVIGLLAGLFAQGVVTGELEHREQLNDERRARSSTGDA